MLYQKKKTVKFLLRFVIFIKYCLIYVVYSLNTYPSYLVYCLNEIFVGKVIVDGNVIVFVEICK